MQFAPPPSTHLYGRRLVVEWASGETSIEEMRDRTRQQWDRQQAGQTGHKRVRLDNDGGPHEGDE